MAGTIQWATASERPPPHLATLVRWRLTLAGVDFRTRHGVFAPMMSSGVTLSAVKDCSSGGLAISQVCCRIPPFFESGAAFKSIDYGRSAHFCGLPGMGCRTRMQGPIGDAYKPHRAEVQPNSTVPI